MSRSLTLIIGHRGSGKTALLKRLSQNKNTQLFYDLDEEIEKEIGLRIKDYFEKNGETQFRKIEVKVFEDLINKIGDKACFIVLGAGFKAVLPETARVVWLKSPTDKDGRIFLDRPALTELPPLEEFHEKYKEREYIYKEKSYESVTVAGVHHEFSLADQYYFLSPKAILGGMLTLLPEIFEKEEQVSDFLKRRTEWGLDAFELRTDLLNKEQRFKLINQIPEDQILYSYRKYTDQKETDLFSDWALELGDPPFDVDVISLHQREKTFDETLSKLSKYEDKHLKLAIEVNSIEELKEGYDWFMKDPRSRSFLPRSKDGRWAWYRLIFKNKMRINFFRESEGSALDQPYFYDWVNAPRRINQFAAIMGSPVHHSYTPEEHYQFMSRFGRAIVRLDLTEEECNKKTLSFLNQLGLTHAAVTSPLKKKIFENSEFINEELKFLKSANTILWSDQKNNFISTNTDVEGLKSFAEQVRGKSLVVWGGGGTQTALSYVFPQASIYSMRTGELINDNTCKSPQTLIWAVGRSRHKNFPPETWTPEVILDLNYSADSPGLEYALKTGAKYYSGLRMFKAQAQSQREFWTKQAGVDRS